MLWIQFGFLGVFYLAIFICLVMSSGTDLKSLLMIMMIIVPIIFLLFLGDLTSGMSPSDFAPLRNGMRQGKLSRQRVISLGVLWGLGSLLTLLLLWKLFHHLALQAGWYAGAVVVVPIGSIGSFLHASQIAKKKLTSRKS